MNQKILKKVYQVFSPQATKIYLRSSEINTIKDFLQGPDNILHICGSPGTGKTVIIKHILKNRKHDFYNYLHNEKIIYQTKQKILVIDEFDKYYSQKPIECKKLFLYVTQRNKKLITISNSLNIFENVLFFNVYSTEEIVDIIKSKLEDIPEITIDESVIRFITIKLGKGDLRKIFDTCRTVIAKCLEDGRKDVQMCDVLEDKENCEDLGINHKLIIDIVVSGLKGDIKALYEKYVSDCRECHVPALNRTDFFLLYDMYKER